MLKCKGYRSEGNPADGYDYDCEYEHSGEISCEDCIMTGGTMSPQTGKLFRGNLKKYQDMAMAELEAKHFKPRTVELSLDVYLNCSKQTKMKVRK